MRIDLTKFCSVDETRVPLLKPWRDGEFTYASDGRVVLRVAAEPGDVANDKAPSAERMAPYFDPFIVDDLAWQKLPELPEAKFEECDKCDGDKVHECDCGHQHDCPACEGSGKVEIQDHIDIGQSRFNYYYLRLIGDLPNLEIAVRGELDPMLLRFDGGVGVLMPMRKDVPWAERASKS